MRERCRACETLQPIDYRPGDACAHCGVVVEPETICAGCAARTIAGRFCRRCGAELVDAPDFGAARMLRAAGVDGFSLRARLAALDPEQRRTLASRFDAERVVVARVVDERAELADRLDRPLGVYTLEDELLIAIPLGDARLATLRASDSTDLAQIFAGSPVPTHRAWAATALALDGVADPAVLAAVALPEDLAACARALHPSLRCWTDPAFRRRAAELAVPLEGHPRWGPYAALALQLATRAAPAAAALSPGLASSTTLLAVRCGLALGDETAVRRGLDLIALRLEALRWLAARAHPDALELAGDDLGAVLPALPAPVPRALVAPLLARLHTVEIKQREQIVWKLGGVLEPFELDQVIGLAAAHRDGRMINALLRATPPFDAEPILRSVVDDDLFDLAWALDACIDAARTGRAGDLGALLDRARGDTRIGVMRMCDALAEAPRELLDRGIRIALGPSSPRTRVAAAVWLDHEKRKRTGWPDLVTFGREDATRIFGSVVAALATVRDTFADRASMREVCFYDWLAAVLRTTQADLAAELDPEVLRDYLASLVQVVGDRDLWAILRSYAAQSVWTLATSERGRAQRAWIVEMLAAGRSDDTDIDYWFQRTLNDLSS